MWTTQSITMQMFAGKIKIKICKLMINFCRVPMLALRLLMNSVQVNKQYNIVRNKISIYFGKNTGFKMYIIYIQGADTSRTLWWCRKTNDHHRSFTSAKFWAFRCCPSRACRATLFAGQQPKAESLFLFGNFMNLKL